MYDSSRCSMATGSRQTWEPFDGSNMKEGGDIQKELYAEFFSEEEKKRRRKDYASFQ